MAMSLWEKENPVSKVLSRVKNCEEIESLLQDDIQLSITKLGKMTIYHLSLPGIQSVRTTPPPPSRLSASAQHAKTAYNVQTCPSALDNNDDPMGHLKEPTLRPQTIPITILLASVEIIYFALFTRHRSFLICHSLPRSKHQHQPAM